MFRVFRGSLLFGDRSEYVVAATQYRAAANTAMRRLSRYGTSARVPATRSLLSAWQFTTDRPAELLAGHRVGANRGTRVAQIRGSVNDAIQLLARDRPKFRCSIHLIPISSSVRPNAGTLLNQKASRLWMGSRFLDIHPCIGYLRTRQLLD